MAAAQARGWLTDLPQDVSAALRGLALSLCRAIQTRQQPFCTRADYWSEQLPVAATVIELPRDPLLRLTERLALAPRLADRQTSAVCREWSELLGAVAQSYARVGDLAVVAAIVRTASRLGYAGIGLTDAEAYILDQQHPDGYFGFYDAAVASLSTPIEPAHPRIFLTAQSLWAIAERGALDDKQSGAEGSERTAGRPVSGAGPSAPVLPADGCRGDSASSR